MNDNNEFDFTIFDKPLKQDKKGRYYLPSALYRASLNKETILVATPDYGKEMVYTYRVHTNKDGSRWIKGNNIAKYWFKPISDAPTRLFLNEEIVEKIGDN